MVVVFECARCAVAQLRRDRQFFARVFWSIVQSPHMKNSWTKITRARLLASLCFFAISILSLPAHPGHDLGAYGTKHIVTSPYHLAVLAGGGLLICWGARFLRHRVSRHCAQSAGVVAMLAAVLLALN